MDKLKKRVAIIMKAKLQGWNFIRILRLVLGITILMQGIVAKDTLPGVLGLILGGMAVANMGCCGANGCAISKPLTKKTQRIHHEEVDSKK